MTDSVFTDLAADSFPLTIQMWAPGADHGGPPTWQATVDTPGALTIPGLGAGTWTRTIWGDGTVLVAPPPGEASLTLADAATVGARLPGVSPAAVAAVLTCLADGIRHALAGDEAASALSFNLPLLRFTPLQDLLSWFTPEAASRGLQALNAGDGGAALGAVLYRSGLLAATGPGFQAAR